MSSPSPSTPDHAAARKSMESRRRPASGVLRGASRDLGALVRDSRRSLSASGHTLPGAEAGRRGMVLPFTPLNLTFHRLSYCVDLPRVGPISAFNT